MFYIVAAPVYNPVNSAQGLFGKMIRAAHPDVVLVPPIQNKAELLSRAYNFYIPWQFMKIPIPSHPYPCLLFTPLPMLVIAMRFSVYQSVGCKIKPHCGVNAFTDD